MPKKRKSDTPCESASPKERSIQSSMLTRNRKKRFEAIEKENLIEAVYIPDLDSSEKSDFVESEENDESDDNDSSCSEADGSDEDVDSFLSFDSYKKILNNYSTQKKLENDYVYKWEQDEHPLNETLTNEILLSDKIKSQLSTYSFTELFELFFSTKLKNYIVSCTKVNGYDISLDRLEAFIGIITSTIINRRLSQRDYCSTDPLLRSEEIVSTMS